MSFLGMSTSMTLNDLEPQRYWFLVIFCFSAEEEWIATRWIDINHDYLQTGTAICSRASHEH